MCSLHAGSARDALTKLCTLPLLAGRNIDASFVTPTVASSVDLVLHAELREGRRRIVEIIAPDGTVADGVVEATTLFRRVDGRLVASGTHPRRTRAFETAGIDLDALLQPPMPVRTERPLAAVSGAEGAYPQAAAISWEAVR